MGKINSRKKGVIGEHQARDLLKKYGFEARRGQQFCGGNDSPDIIHNIPKVHIEVKRTESLSVYKAIDQAIQDSPEEIPLVLHRRNHREWLAILPASELLELLSYLKGNGMWEHYLEIRESQDKVGSEIPDNPSPDQSELESLGIL